MAESAAAVDESQAGTGVAADLKEYEVQFFGFTPKSFIDGVHNALVDYLNDSVEATEKFLLEEAEANSEVVSPEFVREASDRLFSHFLKTFDKNFDRLESYLKKNLFHIPSNVLLPEDAVHWQDYSAKDDVKLDGDLESLRQQIRNSLYVNARLRQWLQEAEVAQAQLDVLLLQLNNFHHILSKANISDLSESIVFMAGKARKLQDQLTIVLQQNLRDAQEQQYTNLPAVMPFSTS
ncbi:protein MIS12 homolog [Patiria miniata]|uniref:Protein MIS12 homolog n=1 Tax=Patiria miniata TaxID=46514 RepID=A0A913ZGC0_PATMI|nr:protein MIS12 homolog [Patiria miniata]